MNLTVLGSTGPFPRPSHACSGYLVTDGETRILLECGSGVLSRLLERTSLESIDAIVLSHLHWDHCSDIGALRYALETGWGRETPLPVIVPDTPADVHSLLLEHPVFDVQSAVAGISFRFGSLTLELGPASHPVPCCSVRITNEEGKSLFYTGDTGLFEGLSDAASGADLLLADICFSDADAEERPNVHMSLRQACRVAKEAKVGMLVGTHLHGGSDLIPIPFDFSPAVIAAEGEIYEIG